MLADPPDCALEMELAPEQRIRARSANDFDMISSLDEKWSPGVSKRTNEFAGFSRRKGVCSYKRSMGRTLLAAFLLASLSWISASGIQASSSLPVCNSVPLGDSDGDGLTDLFELEMGFDPTAYDPSVRFPVIGSQGYGLEFRAGDHIVRLQTFFDRTPHRNLSETSGKKEEPKPKGIPNNICVQKSIVVPGSSTGCSGTPKCHYDVKVISAQCRPFDGYCEPGPCAATVGTVSSELNPLCLIGCG